VLQDRQAQTDCQAVFACYRRQRPRSAQRYLAALPRDWASRRRCPSTVDISVDDGTLELSNGTAATVFFFGGNADTLKLDTPTAFTGNINNVVLGDTIDLAGITASSATYNGSTLTVNETNGQQLVYNVLGSVAGDSVNVSSDSNGGTKVYWGIAPVVTSVTAKTDNGANDLDAGHVVTITVDSSEVVNVTGTPTLQLNDNEVTTYQTGTGTNTLTFSYTVQPGNNVADLQVTGLNLPSGATIQDAADNNMSGAVTGNLGFQIDTTPPAFTAVAETPSTGDLNAGKTVTITLSASEAVTVSGTPTLTLNDIGTASYDAAASTPTSLVFDYTVGSGDTNVASLAVTRVNLLDGATIQDGAGNNADLSLSGLSQSGPQIDTTPPSPASIISVTDNVAPVTGTLSNGAYTNDPDPTVRVSLSGTGTLVGDTLQLYNGTGTGSPLGNSYTLTSTDISNGFANVQPGTLTNGTTYTLTARITDAAGNQSAISTNSFTLTEDTTTPTVQVSINNSDVNLAHNTAPVTFAFNEGMASFVVGDTTATGGTLSNLQQINATTYTATFTAAAGIDITNASVGVFAGSYTDLAGNLGIGGNTGSFTVDTLTPTVAVSISNTDVNVANDTGTVTFTFSQAPVDFALTDVTAPDGTLSNLSGSGTTYTATFTANAGVNDPNATVSITGGSYHDADGNAGSGGSTAPFTVDTVTPTVAVSISNTDVNVADDTGTVTFAFNQAPVDFALTDVTAPDGTLSNLSGSGTSYTATFTANAGVDDPKATVSLTAGSYHDADGNAGSGGSTAPFTVDTVTVTVTAAQAIANYQSNPSIGPQLVIDSAANVAANLDGLEVLASASDIVSITLTNTGTPNLTITATQLANDTLALEEIVTPFKIAATGTIGAAAAAGIPSTLAADLTSGLVVEDTAANVTANLSSLNQLAISNELASVIVTDGGFFITIAGGDAPPEIITTVLLEALLNGGNIVSLGNGAPTFHRPDAVLDNTGDTINLGTSAFQNFYLDGGVIQEGTLITGPGGIINSPGGSDASFANTLYDVTVLGGLTLEAGNSLQFIRGSTSGTITVDSSAYLFLNGDFTFQNLTLNGGNFEVGDAIGVGGTTTIAPDGLMQGYGEIVGNLSNTNNIMTLENEGTINSDVAGQLLDFQQTIFFNDGLVEATNGGNISTDFINNNPDGVISVSDGSTLQLEQSAIGYFSRAGNAGLISVGGTVSGPATLYDEGQIRLEGGSIDVSSLTIIAGGELSGFGTVASPIESSGVINARDGKMDLAGPVTRDGQFLISQAATLELGGPTAQAVTFESGGGGTLYLDKATEFSGTVTGLAQADSVDFADFAFSSHPLITNVTGTGAVGSTTDVTIADGSLITTLELLNQYAGEYPIASTAYHLESDHPGSPSAGTLFTTIANPPITAVATSVSGTEGVAISGATVATFTDANPNALASDFTATIDWDDGTTTTGTIVAQTGGDFAVDGTHTYADGGEYAVGVNITDVSGGTASITTSATVAELATLSTLVTFQSNGANPFGPVGGLIADADGDLFGLTAGGGANGDGTVFEIAKTATGYASTPTTLASFNGANPEGSLIADANGDLFGTTNGTVFEIAKTATGYASSPTTLVSFNGTDYANPDGSLIADANGDLFGTTTFGGPNSDGTVFEIAKTATGYASTPITLSASTAPTVPGRLAA
jgi:hypothetical protein